MEDTLATASNATSAFDLENKVFKRSATLLRTPIKMGRRTPQHRIFLKKSVTVGEIPGPKRGPIEKKFGDRRKCQRPQREKGKVCNCQGEGFYKMSNFGQ